MLQAASTILAVVAFAAWVMAVMSALEMLKHRKAGVSGWWFATNGFAFFSGKNFEPGADAPRRRFLRYAGLFALALVAGMAIGILGASMQRA